MEKNNWKGWLYLLPASVFLGLFLVYPLIDVLTYSFEEGYNFASQTYFGTGLYNYHYVLRDPYFLQALKNTLLLVLITVPLSTGLAMLISVGLSSIQKLRELYQTVYFLPYVTNTLAVGLVFMIFFKRTPYSDGLVNLVLSWFGAGPVDFIDGPYWAKMFVLCFYTIWVVLPFKILILTGALASVDQTYYNAAKVDGTPRWRIFTKITLPMISPTVFYLVITGFIGAFKAYSDAVALFGTNLNAAGMNTIVGYIYDMLYGDSGGYPSYAPFSVQPDPHPVRHRADHHLHQPAGEQEARPLLKGGGERGLRKDRKKRPSPRPGQENHYLFLSDRLGHSGTVSLLLDGAYLRQKLRRLQFRVDSQAVHPVPHPAKLR